MNIENVFALAEADRGQAFRTVLHCAREARSDPIFNVHRSTVASPVEKRSRVELVLVADETCAGQGWDAALARQTLFHGFLCVSGGSPAWTEIDCRADLLTRQQKESLWWTDAQVRLYADPARGCL